MCQLYRFTLIPQNTHSHKTIEEHLSRVKIITNMKSSNENEPSKRLLKELYIDKNLSKAQIRKALKLGNKKLTDLLQQYGIKKSPEQINENISRKLQGHPSTAKKKPPIPHDQLKELYINKRMTPSQISQMIGRSQRSVREAIDEQGMTKSYKEDHRDRVIRSQQKYGVDHVSQTIEWKQKHYETMKKNKTFNTSQPEDYVYAILEKKFGKKNVIRQYRSEVYPFNCDFYIKSLDLYLEFQGSWCHYSEPFNLLNYRHLNQLREWKRKSALHPYYEEAIRTWTIRDPLKRKYAKKNKLNWVEFFTVKDLLKWVNE